MQNVVWFCIVEGYVDLYGHLFSKVIELKLIYEFDVYHVIAGIKSVISGFLLS
jgi:hypothetical protein